MLFLCLKVSMEIQYSLCLKQKGRETLQGNVIDSWEERLRLTLDHFRNENMADFRKNSEAYRRLAREEEEAYAKLDTLNLTEEQREIIEEAFEAQSAAEAEYATESYFCGIADCIRFLKYIEGPRGEQYGFSVIFLYFS